MPWLKVADGGIANLDGNAAIHINTAIIAEYKGNLDPPLETILEKARILPKVHTRSIDSLLAIARQKCRYVHAQEDVIMIDGVDYERWQFCEPYYIYWGRGLRFCVPEQTTIYIECVLFDATDLKKFKSAGTHVMFADNRIVCVETSGLDKTRRLYPMPHPRPDDRPHKVIECNKWVAAADDDDCYSSISNSPY